MQDSDGLFRSKQESYKAVQNMMASLNDRYTEFLTPTQVVACHSPRYVYSLEHWSAVEMCNLLQQVSVLWRIVATSTNCVPCVVQESVTKTPAHREGVSREAVHRNRAPVRTAFKVGSRYLC